MTPQPHTGPHASAVADVRHVPLNQLTASTADALRRIVPPEDTARVPVAAFNASL
jgi:FXSXX-COOH protein